MGTRQILGRMLLLPEGRGLQSGTQLPQNCGSWARNARFSLAPRSGGGGRSLGQSLGDRCGGAPRVWVLRTSAPSPPRRLAGYGEVLFPAAQQYIFEFP